MRIQKIAISNFRGFYDSYEIDLGRDCRNLLVYGENGSGKSSLYHALDLFLESYEKDHEFSRYHNIFAKKQNPTNQGYIKLTLRENLNSGEKIVEWSPSRKETSEPEILRANKAKGFFDYKRLLETYFLHKGNDTVNLFNLVVGNLLSSSINDITKKTFLDDWNELQSLVSKRMTDKNLKKLEDKIKAFNAGFKSKLGEVQKKASEILLLFDKNIQITLDFDAIGYNYEDSPEKRELTGQTIILRVTFMNQRVPRHHDFLNEAKLSGIALSIYLASLLVIPQPEIKLLVLDDVLIGLDMANRFPILDILDQFFSDHQIIITTYDRNWFELVRRSTETTKKWSSIEFFCHKTDEFEMPIIQSFGVGLDGSQELLEKAKIHFDNHDYKASALYIRAAFELVLKYLAKKKNVKVPYNQAINDKMTAQELLAVTKDHIEAATFNRLEKYKDFILNPLSHSQLINVNSDELEKAREAVRELRDEVKPSS